MGVLGILQQYLMAGKPLTAHELDGLLKPKAEQKPVKSHKTFQPPPDLGPLKLVDESLPCIVAGYYVYEKSDDYSSKKWVKTTGACRTPTFIRVRGAPTCHIHAIRKLNEMLIEAGVTQ